MLMCENAIPLVGYTCESCENNFFAYDDTAEICPFCGGKVEPIYGWNVSLVEGD